MSDDASRSTLSTVERAADVLAIFAHADRADLGVTEVANRLGLSKTVVHRVLATLTGKGILSLDEDRHRYRLGSLALRLGMTYLANVDVRDLALPRMRELAARTAETVTISLRNGWTRVYIDQVPAAREVRMAVTLGQPVPLHVGGSSKVLLAFLESQEQEQYLTSGALDALTEHTVTNADALRQELATIREQGYAATFGERLAGAGSVAAPILDHRAQPAAVLSVCGPVDRFRPRAEEIAPVLLAETRSLSEELGYHDTDSAIPD